MGSPQWFDAGNIENNLWVIYVKRPIYRGALYTGGLASHSFLQRQTIFQIQLFIQN